MKLTRAGNFTLMALPITLLAGYFVGGMAASEADRQKQEQMQVQYGEAYGWCIDNMPDPTQCQWGAYKALHP